MLRSLIGNYGTVDAQFKVAVDMKRGMVVAKNYANKTAVLPVADATEVYFVDRGLVNDAMLSVTGTLSDYEDALETVKANEFVGLITPIKGQKWGTDAYTGVDADFDAGKYVKVAATGKFIASAVATPFRSAGFYTDNGHKLVAIEIVA